VFNSALRRTTFWGGGMHIYLSAFLNLEFWKCDCVAYRFAYFGPGKGRPVHIRQNAMWVQNRF